MQLGDVIRILRTSQNMTQKELAMNILDRGNLSKIEHNLLEPSYTNFHLLISKLGISADEFEYIRNEYSCNAKAKLMYEFFKLHYNTDQQQINILLSKCSNFKEDIEIQRIITILQAMQILGGRKWV
ncbi:helix-turn-helix transcriptional regulator [Lactobacillus sp. ESL0785]|uniref:helix-turn-helix domain-containing protein n=1 Tax=Lactobacillus sp. ESL0785 TaxID=2983232 RepID=UPI0023F9872A|nr:helix-turn-helix transcriptional regulator [Lactobacillus sp. ESL0785]WEV71647.1 helix-turn-helix transcriptional regulator [Lactobacillus sp. ESL0785]